MLNFFKFNNLNLTKFLPVKKIIEKKPDFTIRSYGKKVKKERSACDSTFGKRQKRKNLNLCVQKCVCDNYFDKRILRDHIKRHTKIVTPKITECCDKQCPPGYDEDLQWNDTVIPQIKDCAPCENKPPKRACKLRRPKRRYDPMDIKYCIREIIDDCPQRLDDLTGMNIIRPKNLPRISCTANKCKPCSVTKLSTRCVPLKKPKKLYDDSKMKVHWGDICIPDRCPPRMDKVLGLKVRPKKLPKFRNGNMPCKPCDPIGIDITPGLKRLKPKYNINFDVPCHVEDECEIQPPRMDTVLCWRPKRKRLPKLTENRKRKINPCCC